jgi:hypothetical protein
LEKAPELGIALHDEEEIEMLLAEGEDTSLQKDLGDEDYRQHATQTWGLKDSQPTNWETGNTKVTSIHPNAHITTTSARHAAVIYGAMLKSNDLSWSHRLMTQTSLSPLTFLRPPAPPPATTTLP